MGSVWENISCVRITPHVYTRLQDLDKLVYAIEKIAKKEFGIKEISVISGIGVRNYYRKLGYRLKDTYMVKYVK